MACALRWSHCPPHTSMRCWPATSRSCRYGCAKGFLVIGLVLGGDSKPPACLMRGHDMPHPAPLLRAVLLSNHTAVPQCVLLHPSVYCGCAWQYAPQHALQCAPQYAPMYCCTAIRTVVRTAELKCAPQRVLPVLLYRRRWGTACCGPSCRTPSSSGP